MYACTRCLQTATTPGRWVQAPLAAQGSTPNKSNFFFCSASRYCNARRISSTHRKAPEAKAAAAAAAETNEMKNLCAQERKAYINIGDAGGEEETHDSLVL